MTYEYKAYPKFLYAKDGTSVLIKSEDEIPEGDYRDSPVGFDNDVPKVDEDNTPKKRAGRPPKA